MDQQAKLRTIGSARPAMQLHTLRDIEEPLPEIIRRVARAGYEGVEFAGRFLEADPHAVREALTETATTPVAAHVELPTLERNPEAIVDRCRVAGCTRAVIPHIGENHFRTEGRVEALAWRLDALADRLADDGMELSYHNTREPFLPTFDQFGLGTLATVPVPGVWGWIADAVGRTFDETDIAERTGFGALLERTTDRVTFEVDVGWVAAGGYDPVAVFDLLGDRLALVHIADVAVTRRFPPRFRSVPPGEGIIDLDRVVAAARETDVEWLVFEDDHPADPLGAIDTGIDALVPPEP